MSLADTPPNRGYPTGEKAKYLQKMHVAPQNIFERFILHRGYHRLLTSLFLLVVTPYEIEHRPAMLMNITC